MLLPLVLGAAVSYAEVHTLATVLKLGRSDPACSGIPGALIFLRGGTGGWSSEAPSPVHLVIIWKHSGKGTVD